MQKDSPKINSLQDSEINLIHLFQILKNRLTFILSFTCFSTFLAILFIFYQSNLPVQYRVETTLLKPSDGSVFNINTLLAEAHNKPFSRDVSSQIDETGKFNDLSEVYETSESIFSKFLKKVGSKSFQKRVLLEGSYIDKLIDKKESIDDTKKFANEIVSSSLLEFIEVETNNISRNSNNFNYQDYTKIELPYILSIVGDNPEVLSEYLDEVVQEANKETVQEILNLSESVIESKLNQLMNEKKLLLEKAKKDRLSQIQRIKEEDAQKIRELNDRIEASRYKAKNERLNEIQVLTDAAKLAGSLGIIENNLGQINASNNDINLNIAINEGYDLPEWYLFGEKALLERVEILKSRASDDPFIPELVSLNNQINEIQNNNLLKTLEERQDDSPFIARISEIEIEIDILKSIVISNKGIDTTEIQSFAEASPISNALNFSLIILIALFGGFMLSIFLLFFMQSIKSENSI